jgi:hypothetical protein
MSGDRTCASLGARAIGVRMAGSIAGASGNHLAWQLAYQLCRTWSFRGVQLLVRVGSAWAIHAEPILIRPLRCSSAAGSRCAAHVLNLQASR